MLRKINIQSMRYYKLYLVIFLQLIHFCFLFILILSSSVKCVSVIEHRIYFVFESVKDAPNKACLLGLDFCHSLCSTN